MSKNQDFFMISGNWDKNPPPLFVEPRFLDLADFGFGPVLGGPPGVRGTSGGGGGGGGGTVP